MTPWVLMSVMVSVASPQFVSPDGRDGIGVVMGEKWVPRSSTVLVQAGACLDDQVGVSILSVSPWYRAPNVTLAQPGDQGCLSQAILTENADFDGEHPSLKHVQNAFFKHYGPIDESRLMSTPWGRVALPMQHELTPAEREAEYKREHLQTPKQRERATDALGPSRDGVPIYTHFLGSDAPRSDRWGTPAMIIRLLSVFDGWATHCREELPQSLSVARPETCTVQVGDLAWYSDIPYRLGHRTHFKGNCVDIRLFRDDGSKYEAWWNRPDDRPEATGGYSRELTQAFLEFVVTRFKPSVLYFNDPDVLAAVSGVESVKGHDDHIHLCF